MKKAVGLLAVVAVSIFAGAALAQMTGPGTMGGGHRLAGAPGARLTPQ